MNTNGKNTFSRRRVVASMLAGGVTAALFSGCARAEAISVNVWKSPSCGCCKDWVQHLEDNGFDVTVHDVGNTEARQRLGIPARLGSCHTAEVGGYAVEGHVPAREVLRLLDEKPDAIGLTVPAMPRGSPGMDGPMYGGVQDPYDVLLITANGEPQVFQSYR